MSATPETIFIYILIDPRDYTYRYVGKTTNPKRRRNDHIKYIPKANTPNNNWLRKLSRLGLEPILRILMDVPFEFWEDAEKAMIRYYREIGAPLLNVTDGGEGGWVVEWTEERRAQYSEVAKRRWAKEEFRERAVKSIRRASKDPARLSKLSETGKRSMESPEARKRASEKLHEIWNDPKERERRTRLAREKWDDPDFRERCEKGLAATWTPERHLEQAELTRKQWEEDPSRRQRLTERNRVNWNNPRYRARMIGLRKARAKRVKQLELPLGLDE